MSFADILPYLAGGLAGAAVPGLGRGAGRAISMQQAFERGQKQDERYEEEKQYRMSQAEASKAERAEEREYRRLRDTAGDIERKGAFDYRKGRDEKLDRLRAEDKEYSRNLDKINLGFKERAESREVKSIAETLTRQKEMDAMTRGRYNMALQDFSDRRLKTEEERLWANKIREEVGAKLGQDLTGVPAGIVWEMSQGLDADFDEMQKQISRLMDASANPNVTDEQRQVFEAMAARALEAMQIEYKTDILSIDEKERQKVLESLAASGKWRDMTVDMLGQGLAETVGRTADLATFPLSLAARVMPESVGGGGESLSDLKGNLLSVYDEQGNVRPASEGFVYNRLKDNWGGRMMDQRRLAEDELRREAERQIDSLIPPSAAKPSHRPGSTLKDLYPMVR